MTESSTWPVLERHAFERKDFEGLFTNQVAAVRVPDFVPPDMCAKAVARIEEQGFGFYEDVDPPIGRIGITQNEHRAARQGYFAGVRAAEDARAQMFSTTADPVMLLLDVLAEGWGPDVDVAREPDGRPYFAGIVRVIGEALIHCDWAPHDAPGWAIGSATAQLSWNVYYSLSEGGGETTVFRRPWSEDLQAFANTGNYGYRSEAADGCPRRVIAPRQGELVIFNSRNLHCVNPSTGEGARITASSFVGRMPSDGLVLWS